MKFISYFNKWFLTSNKKSYPNIWTDNMNMNLSYNNYCKQMHSLV